jgi:hypothetical protein
MKMLFNASAYKKDYDVALDRLELSSAKTISENILQRGSLARALKN